MSSEPLHEAPDLPVFQALLMPRKVCLWLQGMTDHCPFAKYFLVVVPSLDLLNSSTNTLSLLPGICCRCDSDTSAAIPWQSLQISGSISVPTFFLCYFLAHTALPGAELVFPCSLFPCSPPQVTHTGVGSLFPPEKGAAAAKPSRAVCALPHSHSQGCTFRSCKELLAASYTTKPGKLH